MNGFGFQKNCRFERDGMAYLVMRINPDKSIVAERISDGQVSCWASDELLKAFTEGTLTFLDPVSNGESGSHYQRPITDLNDDIRSELERRIAYVSAVREVAPSVHTLGTFTPIVNAVAQRIGDPRPPSFTTLYKWVSKVTLYGEFRALIPRYDRRGPRHSRQDPRIIELFEESVQSAFSQSPQATIGKVIDKVRTLVTQENALRPESCRYKIPSQATCYRMFALLDQYEQTVLREGKRIAMRKFKLAGAGAVSTRILERVEIDHTPLDLFLIDEETSLPLGRPTLTIVLDHNSRMPLGYHLGFNAPSTAAVLAALRHAILPKEKHKSTIGLEIHGDWPCYGIPESIVVDNGLEFHGKALEQVAFNLGIQIQFCPKKEPQFKGVVERYLKTINYSFVHMLPGTSYAKYYQRGDYDPQEHAVLTLREFRELFEKWIIDVYAKTIHRSLNTTPLEKWNSSAKSYTPRLPRSLGQLTAEMAMPCKRRLRHDGIMLLGLHYSHDDLAPILRRFGPGVPVTVTYDPNDLGTIRVFDPDSNEKSYFAYAKNFEYANGLTLDQHRLIRRELIRQGLSVNDSIALSLIKQEIRDKVQELSLSKKHSKRRYAARLRGAQKEATANKVSRPRHHKNSRQTVNISHFLGKPLSGQQERSPLPTFKMRKPRIV
ncbi:Mu transposase C-terminal domain-containing protein [Advenella sp. FME57]|uniref:Mu transposase C-terminal domain-containing protein n=1 Tax=Advenella sp. FME57 TaxID=2742604 RepID=UPI001867414D|nr:Mu transposase C-terminal domain-containing protein [Advenella sp. FME57]